MENKLGYKFKNKDLLTEALSHPSFFSNNKPGRNYERLEFLGDSVLSLVVSVLLYEKFPDEAEGNLAKRRSGLVCGKTLSSVAKSLDIGPHLNLGTGEEMNKGRDNEANLENAFEAIIGAIYLDGGIEEASKFVLKHLGPLASEMSEPPKDPKTELQELVQGNGDPIPEYKTIGQKGPSHAPIFTVEVRIKNHDPVSASGSSKREAERKAASKILAELAKK